ncbi:hypothetical protein MMC31_002429, partial [Peltigera leucophlebia]|nr:hypothetical protein [Peltigera leucophlebia]
MSDNDPSPPRDTPHIRLNSSQDNIIAGDAFDNRPKEPANPQSLRSLVPQRPHPLSPRSTRNGVYRNGPAESAELLLPPSRRLRRFRDEDSAPESPIDHSSRRTSWSSEQYRDSRMFYGMNPFDDSRAPSRAGSDEENVVNTQTVGEKYNIMPSAGLLLFPEDVEKDDYLHNPDPNEKEHRECDIFTKRGAVNVGGLAFIVIGLLVLFIGYPILTFVQNYTNPPDACDGNPDCIHGGKQPLLKNIRTGLIDPDTPKSAMTKKAADGSTLKLVFSDEFNTPGRSFYPGDDPYWTAVDIWYGVTQDLEWYDPDAVTTKDGVLEIRFDAFQNHNLNYRSGMVQSWNQLCFKGGLLEASISLPGKGDVSGFWPGFWAMGNLGRPGYAATTDGLWPYSYHDGKCDPGITANQSQTDGLSFLPGMRLPACTCGGEDHPSPGKSRSAPEIDVIEASVSQLGPPNKMNMVGVVSQSCQIAPFDIWYQPNTDFIEIYDQSITILNSYQGGTFQQALSGLTNLNNNWYDGQEYQTYNFEYTPGDKGKIVWAVGEQSTWTLDARSLGPNGNVGQRTIPTEPMAMVMNFGMSNGFAPVNLPGLDKLLPAVMRFDYVRIYQNSDSQSVTCDPPGYETTSYIRNHMSAYTNPNLTQWDAKYKWPKNSFVND